MSEEGLQVTNRPEQVRSAQVKQLEEKIKKLEKENKKLLNKVHTSTPSPERSEKGDSRHYNGCKSLLEDDELEDGLLDLKELMNEDEFREDEWLYVSPKLPPTPIQKKVTPRQWLSDQEESGDLPSLDDVRKSLLFNIEEAENLSEMMSRSFPATSNTKRKLVPGSGRKLQGHANDRLGKESMSSGHSSDVRSSSTETEAVPVVKWKARVPAEHTPSPGEDLEEDVAPVRKWKVKQVPSSSGAESGHPTTSAGSTDEELERGGQQGPPPQRSLRIPNRHENRRVDPGEDVPVVKWKARMPADNDESSSDVPVVKWKARMPANDDESSSDVPVVKWKARMPANDDESSSDVPVVKWKARMPADDDESPSDVPVVKWKAKMPAEGETSDVPVVKWKARMPQENSATDVPVVKWKAKMPAEDHEETSDVPVVKRKARMPQKDSASDAPMVRGLARPPPQEGSDVPVVKWRAKVPEASPEDDIPVVKRKARKPEAKAPQENDVPVVKWKAKMPEDAQTSSPPTRRTAKVPHDDGDVPVVKWKAKLPEDAQTTSPPVRRMAKMPRDEPGDVPVVKWKAKMPQNEQNHEAAGAAVVRKKARVPDDEYVPEGKWKPRMPQQGSDVPAARRRAKQPPDDDQNHNVPVVKWKAKMPADSPSSDVPASQKAPMDSLRMQGQPRTNARSPKGIRLVRKAAKVPPAEETTEGTVTHSPAKDQQPRSSLPEPVTPPLSPVSSPAHQAQDEETSYKPRKPVSRHGSFSESRSPSPPSISPHVRMAIASPVLSRRTPSPSRSALTASLGSLNSRQSPSASPSLQSRQLQQYMSGGGLGTQHSPGSSRSFTGSPGSAGPKLRTPRSQSTGLVKPNSPLKGLTPPGERKAKRVLPPGPDPGRSRSRERTNMKAQHISPPVQRVAQQASPGADTGDDDDSWLEGCF